MLMTKIVFLATLLVPDNQIWWGSFLGNRLKLIYDIFLILRSLVEACNEGDISKVRKLLDEGRVSVHDTTEEGESLLSLACSAGYFELAQVSTRKLIL